MNKNTVYLAGGFRSNWQDVVMSECDGADFYNPKAHGLVHPQEYTVWDLHAIKQSDILFAYLEKDNPSGYGLTLEIGYAKGLGKTIILVDEKSSVDESTAKYFAIVVNSSDIVFNSLKDGIHFLKSFCKTL